MSDKSYKQSDLKLRQLSEGAYIPSGNILLPMNMKEKTISEELPNIAIKIMSPEQVDKIGIIKMQPSHHEKPSK